MKKCPYCGKDNDDKAKTCEHCYAGFPNENKKETEHETPANQERVLRKRARS